MTTKKELGIVYVLTNKVMPGLVKIGMTTRSDIDARMKELYTTGVPVPFDCVYACLVKPSDCEKIEKALHKAFEPYRINPNREFFEIKPEQATSILQLFNQGDVTDEVKEEMDNELDADDKIAKDKVGKRRPSLNFYEMGLHKGDILTYDKDPKVKVTIFSEKKVMFENDIYSLTAVTKQLLNVATAVQPTPHWNFEGRSLTDLYNETYPPTEEE
jgi:hypothetical protein